jgi:uncharacterized protein (TIGR03086 family)
MNQRGDTVTGPDPRLMLNRAFDQAALVVNGVTPEQLHLPTPCAEFDVAALLTHLVGAAGRVSSLARGEVDNPRGGQRQTEALPIPDDLDAIGWSAAFETCRQAAATAWADDEVLERKFELPWGTFNGVFVAQMYTMELTVHGWDLATATDQRSLLDDDLATATLAGAYAMLPPEPRGGFIPFEAVVPVAEDAPAYDRLAAYLGRSVA